MLPDDAQSQETARIVNPKYRARIERLMRLADAMAATGASGSAGSAWERDAALQLKAGVR